ncbi:uncharacterized protein EV154DRAFT_77264 [Mucor mucedo]|uniref:uncharacterized protein n=1 Tax=Mucor mucedo TaxID=29922 RepID=UPI00221FB3B2|nr:uncharacterized protein EV154DRAFT_77264 [Mucor mucedo]KAI7875264.1 hypothetical protein EV154DRAFT_77264 [Mucor mucedo]
MCDTNWCTFCDCAVSPYSDSVYCSDECYRRDASFMDADLSRYSTLPPHRRSNSISSEDLALMYSESIHSPLPDKTVRQSFPPPLLSSSISPANSHEELALRTPINVSCDSPICEKLDFSTDTPDYIFNSIQSRD